MAVTILMALAATAAAASAAPPSAEAESLGRRLAATGTLASLLPLMAEKETAEIVAAHPDLGADGQARLRATARRVADEGSAKILAAEGHSYAAALSVEDLRALVAFNEGDAARRQRAALPQIIGTTMRTVGTLDFKGDVARAFCAETGKLCPAPPKR